MGLKKEQLVAILIIGIVLINLSTVAADGNKRTRVIAKGTSFISKILYRIQGCSIVHALKDATSLECPPRVVERLNLRPDRVFHVVGMEAIELIGADSVWSRYGATGKGVTVAVLDTGVDFSHQEFASDERMGLSFVGYTPFYSDDNGHGTHVAGVITADGLDKAAMGVAPEANVWAGKVCDASGNCWESDIAVALEYLVENRVARIVSLSIGGEGTEEGDCDKDYLAKKVNWAVGEGLVVVAAAGNDPDFISVPACASGAIAVGGTDLEDDIAPFSGRGRALDLVAPAVNIYSTAPGGEYSYYTGTSMAVPVVSGTIALLLEKNPHYTVEQVKTSIYEGATFLNHLKRDQGRGRTDAMGAFEYELPLEP